MINSGINKLLDRLKSSGQRIIVDAEQQADYINIMHEVCSGENGKPRIMVAAEFLYQYASRCKIKEYPDELIVGSQRFARADCKNIIKEEPWPEFFPMRNHGHICVDYGRVLRRGINGLRADIEEMPEGINKVAFIRAIAAFTVFIGRHGCGKLAERPPETFYEALQLVWFIQVFLHIEGNAAAVSFGRFDKYMSPLLENDLRNGVITYDEARELLSCFCIKCCEGDESQNLTLGGAGEVLTVMLMEVMSELHIWQPSLSLRVNQDTSDEVWDAALKLCASGSGMPSFFNERVVTAALRKLDIPLERAEDWGIVGCYEAAPDGDSYPLTVAGGISLLEIFWDYLQNNSFSDSYNDFYSGFKEYFKLYYKKEVLPGFVTRWDFLRLNCTSPFESICVTGCLESGLAAEEGGAKYNLYGVNILGLGSLIDSILSIKKLIYEEKEFTIDEVKQQLMENFPDRKLLLRCRRLPDKFGSNSAVSNELADDLSSFIAGEVLDNPLPNGVRPYPAFFWFGQDINRKTGPSLDGRLNNDRISYGCGPGVFLEKMEVTSILNSAAFVDHSSCACGNPLTISINQSEVAGAEGRRMIRLLIEEYFRKGGFHLHFNIVDPEQLKAAKESPEMYNDLVVRVSGYSATFVNIDEPWQDAIIERTKLGM